MVPAAEPGTAEAHDILDSAEAGPASIRGGAVRLVGYALGSALSIVAAAILFRTLGVEDSGRYVTIISIVTLVGTMTDAGLVTIGVREFSTRGADERPHLIRSLLGLRILLTAVGMGCAVAFAVVAGYDDTIVLGVAIGGVAFLLQGLQATLTVPLLSSLRFVGATAAEVLRQGVLLVGFAAWALAGASLLGFVAAGIPAAAVALVFTAVLIKGVAPRRPTLRGREWRALLRDVLPFAISVALFALYLRAAIILVSLEASEYETGLFGASSRVIEALVAIPMLIVGAAFPIFARAARDDQGRFGYVVGRSFDACLLLGAGLAVVLVAGAPLFVRLLGGSEFAASGSVLQIQAVALAASFVGSVWAYTLVSLSLYRSILVVSTIGLVSVGVLVTVLVGPYGADGAALATVIAEVLVALGFGWAAVRGGVRPQITVSAIPKVALAAALALSPLLLGGVSDGLAAVLSAVIFTGVVLALRAVPEEIVVAIRDQVSRRS